MMISRNILLTAWMVCSMAITAFAQDNYQASIQHKIDSFTALSNAGEWDKALDFMYPKLFTKVPKEQLTGMMREVEGGLTIHTSNIRITKTEGPVEEHGETFMRADYTGDMKVTVIPGGLFDSPKAMTAIDQQFKAIYGTPQVTWDDKMKQWSIKANKSMMAIRGADNEWKLVEINTDQPELMEFLFSQDIIARLVRP